MSRTTVDLDRNALERAQRALGTKGLSETVNEALRRASREHALATFDVRELPIAATPEQIEAGRHDRFDAGR